MSKILREKDFNGIIYMLENGNDVETIVEITDWSAATVNRVNEVYEVRGDYALYDKKRKERTAKIKRNNGGKEKKIPKDKTVFDAEQIGIDDVMPPVDPLIMVRDAINKITEVVENLMKQLCEILRGA